MKFKAGDILYIEKIKVRIIGLNEQICIYAPTDKKDYAGMPTMIATSELNKIGTFKL